MNDYTAGFCACNATTRENITQTHQKLGESALNRVAVL